MEARHARSHDNGHQCSYQSQLPSVISAMSAPATTSSSTSSSSSDPSSAVVHGPISLLADVEVHLLMHSLGATGIAALARCSRRFKAVCESPFAWAHVHIHINLPAGDAPDLTWIASSPLLRHARVAAVWTLDRSPLYGRGGIWWQRVKVGLSCLECTAGVAEFDMRQIGTCISAEVAAITLRAPIMQRVEVLRLGQQAVDDRLLTVIQGLRSLRTLTIVATRSPAMDDSSWARLADLPQLTRIDISDFEQPDPQSHPSAAISSVLTHLTRCGPLKHLVVRRCSSDVSCFRALADMGQLETLELYGDPAAVKPTSTATEVAEQAQAFSAAFDELHSLHTLTVSRLPFVESLLPHVARAQNLRCLVLHPDYAKNDTMTATRPTPFTLGRLLLAASALRCTLPLRDNLALRCSQAGPRLDRAAYLHRAYVRADEMSAVLDRFALDEHDVAGVLPTVANFLAASIDAADRTATAQKGLPVDRFFERWIAERDAATRS